MGAGRFIILLLPLALTAATFALDLVTFLSSYKSLKGLKNVYFLKIDFSGIQAGGLSLAGVAQSLGVYNIYQIGANGFCYGNKNTDGSVTIVDCETPTTPFWFNIEDIVGNTADKLNVQLPSEVTQYNNVLKATSYALWSCLIATVALSFLALLAGLVANRSRGASLCASFLSFLAFLTALVSAGAATGLYKIYGDKFNDTASTFGATASLGTTGLVLVWVAAGVALIASFTFILTLCCGSTRGKGKAVVYEE